MRAGPLLLLLLLAGCLGAPAPGPGAPPAARFHPPVLVDAELPGAEPVVAVAPDGAVYVEAVGSLGNGQFVNALWKSADGGATFRRVALPPGGGESAFDGYLAITGRGRVLLSNSAAGVAGVLLSDDGGATWVPGALAQPASHRTWFWPVGEVVHAGIDTLGGPSFYYVSRDGGATWGQASKPHDYGNLGGPVLANAEGVVVWARYFGEGGAELPTDPAERGWHAVTSRDGLVWERHLLAPVREGLGSVWAGGTVDPDGRFYLAWAEWNATGSAVYYAHAADGRAWSAPVAVASGPGSRVMPWVAAAGAGALGLVWYENPTHAGDPLGGEGPWFAAYARVEGAAGPRPSVRVERAAEAPLHEGGVCLAGPACAAVGGDRRLLDYPGIAFGPDGRAHLALSATQGFGLPETPRTGRPVVVSERAGPQGNP